MNFPSTRRTDPLPLSPALIKQDAVSTMPSTRLPEGSGLINQHAGVPQASAPFLTVRERVDQFSSVRRATILLRELSSPDAHVEMSPQSALWWLMTAEQAYNGERSLALHALIAGSVDRDTLAYIVTGKVQQNGGAL